MGKFQDDIEQIGLRIRSIRKARGLTQEALAERAGIHPTFISEVETGKANATIKTILAIASALEIGPDTLFKSRGAPEIEEKITLFSISIKDKDPAAREKIFSIIDILLTL